MRIKYGIMHESQKRKEFTILQVIPTILFFIILNWYIELAVRINYVSQLLHALKLFGQYWNFDPNLGDGHPIFFILDGVLKHIPAIF